ncbi:MAG: 6-hydroxymethylpterin diphosphokinase MptE-like protein [Planctomycetota bacterium]
MATIGGISFDLDNASPRDQPDPQILQRNLDAISRRTPRLAQQIASASPAPLEWIDTPEGVPSGTYTGRALASRRKPLEEARRLVATVDLHAVGAVVTLGFGLGYHAQILATDLDEQGIVLIFEPDLHLLRAVLERIDHSAWLEKGNARFFTGDEEPGQIQQALGNLEAYVSVGVELLPHPASQPRLGDTASRFADRITKAIHAIKTLIVTTMVNAEVTVRNSLMNLGYYAGGEGVGPLKGLCAARPAIVVSAGPSLRRNMALLKTPELRERCVIIAVQTVLKPLLDAGIRPHFVTALDYHEISARFYEGLTPADVEGVQLVAESKANPAILDAFPGPIRLIADQISATLLGQEHATDHVPLTPGATVAHLAYYLARWLGADPVILMGQDLAFTDGQYYAKDAAIHRVWAGELNPFNTLEMLEWQRIVRMRGHLHEATDQLGRKIYSDAQMATYLSQFERDFLADRDEGRTTIDATEGGVRKAGAEAMSLAHALDHYVPPDAALLPEIPRPARTLDETAIERLEHRIADVRGDARVVATQSDATIGLLRRTQDVLEQPAKANALIAEINDIRDDVQAREAAFGIVQRLNQLGVFKRFRVDRSIELDLRANELDPLDEQRRRIERDVVNLEWTREAASALDELLQQTAGALRGGPKRVRDVYTPGLTDPRQNEATAPEARSVDAVIPVRRPEHAAHLPEVLSNIAGLDAISRAIVIAFGDEVQAAVRTALDQTGCGLETSIETVERRDAFDRSTAAARALARDCWRGGLSNLTAWDELLDPAVFKPVFDRLGIESALLLGPDWTNIDRSLATDIIDRHLESPENLRYTFSPAAPGIAPLLLSRETVDDLVIAAERNVLFASIGGLVGYLPVQPKPDPIAKAVCVQCAPEHRDAMGRFEAGAADRAGALASGDPARIFDAAAPPTHLTLELTTTRAWSGERARLLGMLDPPARTDIETAGATDLLAQLARFAPGAALTFAGVGDPLKHPALFELTRHAATLGFSAVHVRTDLTARGEEVVDDLLASGIDVLSVDLLANTESTYHRMHGIDAYQRVFDRLDALLTRRSVESGRPSQWIVPRILRCDAVYEEIEGFFDRWTMVCGHAVIDQLPDVVPGERIEPLGKPPLAATRDAASRLLILCDGSVPVDERETRATSSSIANVLEGPIEEAWAALMARRAAAYTTTGPHHPDCWTGW